MIIWLARDQGDLFAAILLPGQLLGYAIADLVGAWQVGRWERRSGLRVAVREDGGEMQRFAVDPLTLLARR